MLCQRSLCCCGSLNRAFRGSWSLGRAFRGGRRWIRVLHLGRWFGNSWCLSSTLRCSWSLSWWGLGYSLGQSRCLNYSSSSSRRLSCCFWCRRMLGFCLWCGESIGGSFRSCLRGTFSGNWCLRSAFQHCWCLSRCLGGSRRLCCHFAFWSWRLLCSWRLGTCFQRRARWSWSWRLGSGRRLCGRSLRHGLSSR